MAANGILNGSALVKAAGRFNKFATIHGKGRPSNLCIEFIVDSAENYKAKEDQAATSRDQQGKDEFDIYAHNIHNALLKGKIPIEIETAGDKEILEAVAMMDALE